MKWIMSVAVMLACSCKSKPKQDVEVKQKDSAAKSTPVQNTSISQPSLNTTDLENFGELKLKQPYMDVIRVLGEPAARSKATQWEADGLLHEDWAYKSKGIVINMSSEPLNADKTRAIYSLTARAPCTLKTTRGIGIGSSYEEVTNAYKGFIDDSATDETLITVGSVYSGILFSIKDKKVETIFFGQAAE